MKKAIIASTDLLGINDFDSIRQLILNALKVGEIRSIGHEYEKDVETRYRDDNRSPIPFPWDVMNNITQGGYGKGELVIIFGNPGGGKSWAVIDMATHAAKLGFNVLYYTLELSETYVARRMDANLLSIPVDKIIMHREEVEKIANEIPGKIKIKEFPAGKTTLDNIEQHIEQLRIGPEIVEKLRFALPDEMFDDENKGLVPWFYSILYKTEAKEFLDIIGNAISEDESKVRKATAKFKEIMKQAQQSKSEYDNFKGEEGFEDEDDDLDQLYRDLGIPRP